MPWNDGLSAEQSVAASSTEDAVRLLAGPGTGKTRTLIQRVVFLQEVEGVSKDEILVLTFSRAAARELRERLEEAETGIPRVSTLHGFALRQLLRNGAAPDLPEPILIADDFDERWVIQADLEDILGWSLKDVRDAFQDLASDWETLAADTDEWEHNHPNAAFLGAFREHRSTFGYTLRSELVYRVKRALVEQPGFNLERQFEHVLIDEYQDLNKCELAVVRALVERGSRLYVAGDDDQSIYGFRHAFPQGIRDFPADFHGVGLEIEVCHRCGRDILNLAINVAQQDPRREDKGLRVPDAAPDGIVEVLAFDSGSDEARGVARLCKWLIEVEQVPASEILVLHRIDRNQAFSTPIIEAIEGLGLEATRLINPFAILEGGEGREVVCFLRLLMDKADSLAWRELLESRDNRVGTTVLREVYDLALERGISFSSALDAVVEDVDLIQARNRRALVDDFVEISSVLDRLEQLRERPIDEALPALLEEVVQGDAEQFAPILFLLAGEEGASLADVFQGLQAIRDYVDKLVREGEQAGVRFMSMHSAKGLTATAVIVPNAEDQLLPGNSTGEREMGDERRLLYVSLTRATNYLFVTYAGARTGAQSRSGRAAPTHNLSRFLQGITTPRLGSGFVRALPRE